MQIPEPDRLVHLQFRRYAGCPICNMHLRCAEAAARRARRRLHDVVRAVEALPDGDRVALPVERHLRVVRALAGGGEVLRRKPRRERIGSSHPIRILRGEQYANGELSLRGAARLLKVDPESEPAARDSEQAAPRLGLSPHTSPLQAARSRSGAHVAARFWLGVAKLESEPWCGTVDASLLIDEIDRPRGKGSLT
jgi:hypothetical protein